MAGEAGEDNETVDPTTPQPGIDPTVDHVMSEVHLGCPSHFSHSYISHFTFSEPCTMKGRYEGLVSGEETPTRQVLSLDEDGDLVLTRQKKPSTNYGVSIQHKITSLIPSVGLQVWRGSLVLADFILHKIFTSSDFNDIVSLELGAGTGLVGILLARVAKTVFLTGNKYAMLNLRTCTDCLAQVGPPYGLVIQIFDTVSSNVDMHVPIVS